MNTTKTSTKTAKPASDVRDKSDARNSRRADLGRFRPLSPALNENVAADGFIPPHGGYENLLSFQKARIVYDGTVRFCERFVERRGRTYDQMVQAARSGKQNILEGSQASGTSKETEIKLTNVARASLEELLEDYRDFLRVRGAPLWEKDSREALYVRKLGAQKDASYES